MVDKPAEASPAAENESKVADAVAAASATLDANETAPESSTEASDAKPAAEPERKMSDVIRDALQPKEESSASETVEKSEQDDKSAEKPESEKVETEADKAKAKDEEIPAEFHKHPAWQRQIQRAREAEGQVATLKPDAENFRALDKFMTGKGIPHKDAVEAIMLLAMIRDNPEAARESLANSVKALDDLIGNTLSKELQEKVDTGEMTEAAAQELSRAKAKISRDESRRAQTETSQREVEATKQAEKQTTELREGVRSKISVWESQTAATDPDFARKQDLVSDRIKSVLQTRGKLFESPEDALTVTKDAYAYVSARMVPTPPARRAVTSTQGGGSGGNSAAAPKTMKEAIAGALEG